MPMSVYEIMTPRPVTVRSHTTVRSALELLATHQVSALPVVDAHGRVHGVVSEADLIRDLVPLDADAVPAGCLPDRPRYVEDVMTNHPVTVSPDDDIAAAVELITSTAIKSVPVVDAERHVIGILSRADVVRALASAGDPAIDDVR